MKHRKNGKNTLTLKGGYFMHPLQEKVLPLDKTYRRLESLFPKPYDKNETLPYTKTRLILLCGAEYEAIWFSHRFHRCCDNQEIRRTLSGIRRGEMMQQKILSMLKPKSESQLETTISYEQLAVDLTAELAMREKDEYVKAALDFALLEDFDHLYRYADLLESDMGIRAENLVGGYTEIMPGRPTVAHPRHPYDDVKFPADKEKATLESKLAVCIITAAEQQTMNYYMNLAAFYPTQRGRELFTEIGMIEEQHVTQYGGLGIPNMTFLEQLVMHEYSECYLYYSAIHEEKDERLKALFADFYEIERTHFALAVDMLKKYEKKEPECVLGKNFNYPKPLALRSHVDYVRDVLKTVNLTANRESYAEVCALKPNHDFFRYQKAVVGTGKNAPSHRVIEEYIAEKGKDYRFMLKEHPIPALSSRKEDNFTLARTCENPKEATNKKESQKES